MILVPLLAYLAVVSAAPRPHYNGNDGYSSPTPTWHDGYTSSPTDYVVSTPTSGDHVDTSTYVTPSVSISITVPEVAEPTTTSPPDLTTIADIPPFNLDAPTIMGNADMPETIITETVTQTLYSPSITTVGQSTFYTDIPVSSTVIEPQTTASPSPSQVPVGLRPGTEVNNRFIVSESESTFFGLAAPDYLRYLTFVDSIPELPGSTSCVYEYQSVLGGNNQTALGQLWNIDSGDLSTLLDIEDVQQGGIGDCGLGAAIMAMITSGNVEYLRGLTIPIPGRPDPEDVTTAFIFRNGGSYANRLTIVSDTIPKLVSGNCHELLGFQRSLGSRNYLYVAMIEKAFAKYFDAYPELSADEIITPETAGYVGLEGAPVANIFAAFTGGTPRTYARRPELDTVLPGFPSQVQPDLFVATYRCLTQSAPCTAAFPPPDALEETYGTLDEFGSLFITPPGQASFGLITPLGSDIEGPTFNVYDFDQLIDSKYSTQYNLVGGHAYAIDKTRSFWPTGGASLRTGRVTLLNPWGCNPKYVPRSPTFNDADGYCSPSSDRPREITMSLTMFLSTVRFIRTVENMLAPLNYA